MRCFLLLFLFTFTIPAFAQNDEIVRKGGKYVYTGDRGLFKTRYDSIRNFSEGRAAVMKNGKWGYIDEHGKHVMKRKFQTIGDFHGGMSYGRDFKHRRYHTILIDGREFGDWYDTVMQVDSLQIGINIRQNYTSTDTTYNIKKYPGTSLVYAASDIIIHDTVMWVVCEGRYSCQNRSDHCAQLMNTNGIVRTPMMHITDAVFEKNIIVSDFGNPEKQAVINKNGQVSEWYSSVTALDPDYFLIGATDSVGVMNAQFRIVVPFGYTKAKKAGSNFILQRDSVFFLADSTGKRLSENYCSAYYLGESFCLVKKQKQDKTWQLLNASGVLLPAQYFYVFPFSEGRARVINPLNYREYSYIDRSGKQILPWYQREVHYISQGGGGWFDSFLGGLVSFLTLGLVKSSSIGGGYETSVAPFPELPDYDSDYKYSYGTDFQNGTAIITQGLLPVRYQGSSSKTENVYYGVADTSGKVLLEPKYKYIGKGDSMFVVEGANGQGLVTHKGAVLLQPTYYRIYTITDHLHVTGTSPTKCALYYSPTSDTGYYLTDFSYRYITDAGDSMLMISNSDRYGYMDYSGKIVVPMIYVYCGKFENGKALVVLPGTEDDRSFFIDRNGNRVR